MRWQILSVVGVLYAVQFIPAIFIFMTLPIIMREAGHSATAIGLVQLVGIPYVLKFLWAPLIDKYKPGKNRYKSWILILSGIHVTALIVLAYMPPTGPIMPFFVVLLIAITAVSTQDIAVDALAITLMRPNERALGATFQSFGIYLSAVVGAFGFLQLYGIIGWTATLLAQAGLFALPLLLLLWVDEPERPRDAAPVSYRTALRFFTQPRVGRWLALLGTIRLPLIFISLPIRLMMVDQGMSTDEIALWFGLIAMSAAGSAALIFGPLMRQLPRVMAFYLLGFVNLCVLALITFLAANLPDAIRYAIVITWVSVATTDVLLLRCAMDKVRTQSPGFDFSIQVALFTLIAMLASPITGAIIDEKGYMPVFLIALLLALVPLGVLRMWFAPLRKSAVNFDGETIVSTGTLISDRTTAILDSCETHFTEHGINCTRPETEQLLMEAMGCNVEMSVQDKALQVRIETPNDNFMVFIRDEIVEHIAQIDAQAAEQMCWDGGIQIGARPSNFRIVRAIKRREVFPGLIRVTLSGVDVDALDSDGIHIKVMMPEKRGRIPVWPVIGENGGIIWPQGDDKLHTRFVTVRHIRLLEREIDVDIAHHEGGLISDWAALQGDEQEVGVMGPGGDTHLPTTENIILSADLTGLPALARLIEGAEGEVSGHVFAAAPTQGHLERYLPRSQLKVTALSTTEFDEKALDKMAQCTLTNVSYAWFAGEFTTAKVVRSFYQKQFGLFKKNQHSMAYWRKGKPGHNP